MRSRPWIAGLGVAVFFSTAVGNSWTQWGRDPQHWGFVPVAGQLPSRILADVVYDPFSEQEQAEAAGTLLTHFQAPLVDGRDVFMTFKTGTYLSCNPAGSGSPAPCGANA